MSELITLERGDLRFAKYIRGTFSRHKRALPIARQDLKNGKQEVTFEVIPVENVKRPSFVRTLLSALRLPYMTFVVGPVLVVLSFSFWKGWPVETFLTVTAVLSLLFLQASAHFLNDYYDHVKGVDHVRWRGSQTIQRGWVPAYRMQRWGGLALASAAVLGLPSLLAYTPLVGLIGFVALIGVLKFSSVTFGFKNLGFGEFVLFVLSGPVLFLGLGLVSLSTLDRDLFFLGCVFGVLSSVIYFLKNIEEMIVDEASHMNSLARTVGFDRSKALAAGVLTLVPLSFFAWGFFAKGPVWVWWCQGLGLGLLTFCILRNLSKVESCLSSKVREVRREGVRLHFLSGAVVSSVFAAASFIDVF